jgi:hypothetical protein
VAITVIKQGDKLDFTAHFILLSFRTGNLSGIKAEVNPKCRRKIKIQIKKPFMPV